MNTLENIRDQFQQKQSANGHSPLHKLEQNAYETFNKLGVPTVRHEEWKYTRIGSLFSKDFVFAGASFSLEDLSSVRLPGSEAANELVFINGSFAPALSTIRSAKLIVKSLEEAAKSEYGDIVNTHLGNSSRYVKDGLQALNTAFIKGGMFILVPKGQAIEHPVYIYHITDASSSNVLSQPRTLVYISENARVQLVETSTTIGMDESFTNGVVEIITEREALVEYYKIQNDGAQTSQVSTTHFRQVGRSTIHTVTISLNGNIVRNNLNIALEAERADAHLYGLYFLNGKTHIDNHTVVDHIKPNCESNELYKGIISDTATAVFNGKIFVQPDAQKTNAFQSNKNILLSEGATVNTKPQLEIFADDVKCSHGCTVGRLDEEGMFYLQSRGISEKIARSLLVNAFAIDILEHIKLEPIREYVDRLISKRLELE